MIKVHRTGPDPQQYNSPFRQEKKKPQSFKISFKYCWDKQASAEGRKQLKAVRPVL